MAVVTSRTAHEAAPLPPQSVLVIDDDEASAQSIRLALELEGFDVLLATDGQEGVECFKSFRPNLVLLDLVLPGMQGFDLCRQLRAESQVPIVVVSARASEIDRVTALEVGADDFVAKPFSLPELVSRVRAHWRRVGVPPPAGAPVLRSGPVHLDSERHEVLVRGRPVSFTPKEFQLLSALMEGTNRLRTRHFLLSAVWGSRYVGDTKTLDVHVKRLRQKIEIDPHQPHHIITVRGLGYRFIADGIWGAF
ncbi:MAG: response regulator transcription factor [Candidatus Dormibacteraeota bacterium]|nr:response regulator transcription factor [Candidatus Dormibacteraeota bacterium]